jgi:putative acetyltransferase
MRIVPAHAPECLPTIRSLFEAYAAEIQVDLCFQGFGAELASLPGYYAPPGGRLFLAQEGDMPAGCVALRPLDGETCEMKRLYVCPPWRRHGLGRRLAVAVIEAARERGYPRMRLDTLDTMHAALALYQALGFREIPAYCHNPLPGAVFMELVLTPPRTTSSAWPPPP